MLPDRVSNPGPLTYESGALPIALRGPAPFNRKVPKIVTNLHQICFAVWCHGIYGKPKIKMHYYVFFITPKKP